MYSNNEVELLEDIIRKKEIRTFFQPIIDIKSTSIIGDEALSRGPAGHPMEMPDRMFESARNNNKLWDLEQLCRTLAIERANEQCINSYLFLNVDPRIINDKKFKEGFTYQIIKQFNLDPYKIIFEITEKTAIEDYRAFKETLDHYVNQGYKIAIDDTGAGYSGIRLMTETKPQFIKLDMGLIRNIDKDSFKQALCKNLLSLSKITNMKLIAEGVETIDELTTLINIGVDYVQGYYLGRPAENLKDISENVKEQIKNILEKKEKTFFYVSNSFPIGHIARLDKPLSFNLRGKDVREIFDGTKIQGVAIVKENKPVGLIMKNEFDSMLAKPYGNEIYLSRSVDLLMDKNPLIVDYNMSVSEVSQMAMSRVEEKLYDYIIILKDNEYYGVVTVKRLLENKTELEINYAMHSNPLTGLPGNLIIEQRFNQIIEENSSSFIIYLDLNNFKAYNDIYGFENGDRIIKLTSQIIRESICSNFNCEAFIGHIGGDDFIILGSSDIEKIEELCKNIISRFDKSIKGFYDIEDSSKEYIMSYDREGNYKKFNLLSISIAVVMGEGKKFKTIYSAAKYASKIKKECKKIQKSNYIITEYNEEEFNFN